MGYRIWRCLQDPAFSPFGTVPAWNGQTYGQTDRQADGQTHDDSDYRSSIASRGNYKHTAIYGSLYYSLGVSRP